MRVRGRCPLFNTNARTDTDTGTDAPTGTNSKSNTNSDASRLKLTLKLNADANQVDHIFPWARGGKSTRDNFAAVYWGANIFKSDNILHGKRLVDSVKGGWVSQVFECVISSGVRGVCVVRGGRGSREFVLTASVCM